MAPAKSEKEAASKKGSKDSEIDGEHNEWKFKAPYKIHSDDEKFNALYTGSCNCGRVQYQLSREKPLSAKFCHCTTCQVLHGMLSQLSVVVYVGYCY